jgi:hypothetical protein
MRKKIFVVSGVGIILFLSACQQHDLMLPEPESYRNEPSEIAKVEAEAEVKSDSSAQISSGEEKSVVLAALRNPFLTPAEEKSFGEDYKEELKYLNLSAVFYSPKGSYAIIDGRVVREKDVVDNKEVIAFAPEKVILKDAAGKEYVVKVKQVIDEE